MFTSFINTPLLFPRSKDFVVVFFLVIDFAVVELSFVVDVAGVVLNFVVNLAAVVPNLKVDFSIWACCHDTVVVLGVVIIDILTVDRVSAVFVVGIKLSEFSVDDINRLLFHPVVVKCKV